LGDIDARVILLGVRNLVRSALGPHDEEILFLEQGVSIPENTDVLVVCGTAQIIDADHSSSLTKVAELANASVPVRINLGAGSYTSPTFQTQHGDLDRRLIDRIASGRRAGLYRDYKGFHEISCRDQLGACVLNDLGVSASVLPCPSFFSAIHHPVPLMRHDRLIVSVLSGMSPMWDTLPVDVHGLYQSLWRADKTRLFVSHHESEAAMLSALGIPFIECDQDDTFIRLLGQYGSLLSFKGTELAPAWSLGLHVTHIGFHRKQQCGDDFGAGLRSISPWSEEAMQLADGDAALSRNGRSESFRRRWLARYMNDYVALIRGAVRAGNIPDFSPGGPDSADMITQPHAPRDSTSSTKGRYFFGLSAPERQAVPIPLERIQSHHDIKRHEDKLRIETVTEGRTLIFGPYIRLFKGPWRLKAKVLLASPPENNLSIASEIKKGTACLMISQQIQNFRNVTSNCSVDFDHVFFNPSDTGFLEFTFVASRELPVGTVFEFSAMQLFQECETEEEFMRSLADNAAREMVHRLTEQLFEAGDYAEVMTLAPKIRRAGLSAPTISFVIKSALRLNTPIAIEGAVNMAVDCNSSAELRAQHAQILANGGRMTEAYLVLFSDPNIQWFPDRGHLIRPVLVEIGRSMNRMLPAATAAGRLRRFMSPPVATTTETPRASFDRLRVRSEFGFPDHVRRMVPQFLGPPTISIIGHSSLATQREELQRGLEQAERKILAYKVPDVYELEDVFVNRHGEIWKGDGTFLRRVNKAEDYPMQPSSVQNIESLLNACTVEGSKNPYLWCTRQLASYAWRWELTGVDMAVGISDSARTWVPESIRLAAKEAPEIVPVGDAVFARRLILSNVDMHFLARHDAYRTSFDRILERAEAMGGHPNTMPVYISRRDATRRSMRNELQLEEALQARGVKVIALTGLSLVEKISLLRHSPLIIGAHGAGLGLVVFGKIGRKVLEILPVHTPFSHHRVNMPNLSRIMGHEHHHYLALPVRAYDDDSWELNLDDFLRFLDGSFRLM
jgi:hypothetical protein